MPIEALADSRVIRNILRGEQERAAPEEKQRAPQYGNELNKNPGAWPGFQIIVGPD